MGQQGHPLPRVKQPQGFLEVCLGLGVIGHRRLSDQGFLPKDCAYQHRNVGLNGESWRAKHHSLSHTLSTLFFSVSCSPWMKQSCSKSPASMQLPH